MRWRSSRSMRAAFLAVWKWTTLSNRASPVAVDCAAAGSLLAARIAGVLRLTRAHIELRDIFLALAVDADEPQFHVIDIVQRRVSISRDAIISADGHAQRLSDLFHIDPEARRAFAVDLDQQFGLVQPQRGVRIDDAGDAFAWRGRGVLWA